MGSTLDVKTDTGVALISHYYAGEVLSSPHYEHSMSLWNEGADDAVRHDDENSSPKITFGFRHHHFARAVRNAITITNTFFTICGIEFIFKVSLPKVEEQ